MKLSGKLLRRRHSPIGRIIENTAWLLGGKGVGGVLSLFYLAIVTRTLGAEGFGHFALILSTAQIVVALVSFQTWQVIVKYGQDHVQQADNARFGRLLGFCIAIDVAGAAAGCLIAAGVAFLLGPYFGWSEDVSWQALAFCAVMLMSIRSTPMGVLRLFDRFDAGALAETMVPIGRMIGAVVVWQTGPGITAFLIAWAAAELLCAATYWLLALQVSRRRMGKAPMKGLFAARHENQGLWGFLTASNVSITVAMITKQLPVLLVGFFVGAAGAGLYRLAYQLSVSLAKLTNLLSRTIFAELARSHSSGQVEDVMKLFRRTNTIALIAGAAIILLIVTLGKPLLLLVAGPEFAGAYPLLVLLGIAASIELVGVSFEPLLMATGRARASMMVKLLNAVLLLLGLALLLPSYGVWGASAASVAAAGTGIMMMGWMVRRSHRA